jgi:tripartite-type tricarboxylate transporter receptor subunit TctC
MRSTSLIDIRLCRHQKKELFVYPTVGYQFAVNSQRSPSEEGAMTAHQTWFRVGLLCLLATSASAGSAHAQTYPAGPVKFITPLAAGTATDPAMRIVIDQLGRMWGQHTVLVNQPGAGGAIAARAAATAAPDGATLFMAVASTFVVLPEVQPNLPFNVSDFVPISFLGEVPMVIAASPALPVSNLPDLIAYSKRQTGGLNVAAGFRGGIPHLTAELLRSRSGAALAPVLYPGGASAMNDLISGRVPIGVEGLTGPIAAGQLKLLAVAAPARLPSRPDLPTVAETLPGFAASGWFVLVAPPGTPATIAKKASDDLRAVLALAEVKQRFDAFSISTRAMSPEELAQFVRSERQLWRPVIKQAGLEAQ